MGNHASVDADSRVLGTVDEPFEPVLGAICMTGLNANPICVDLVCGLDPIPRIGDEVGRGL